MCGEVFGSSSFVLLERNTTPVLNQNKETPMFGYRRGGKSTFAMDSDREDDLLNTAGPYYYILTRYKLNFISVILSYNLYAVYSFSL